MTSTAILSDGRSSFYNQVYGWMCAGLGITGAVAWLTSVNSTLVSAAANPWILIPAIIIQFILVMVIAGATRSISATAATFLFLVYAALNGFTLSVIFLAYAKATIAAAFFISAGTFGACSIYGALTKRDLTNIGSLCLMALIGLIIAMIANIFIASTALDWIINCVGVLVFVGLTAYDTQKLKELSYGGARFAIVGSLELYLDFVNLFLFIIQIIGGKGKKD